MFIITKLDVHNHIVSVEGSFETKEICLSTLFSKINKQDETSYVNKINDKQHILVYKINKGYITNTKHLIFIYQMIEVEEPDVNK